MTTRREFLTASGIGLGAAVLARGAGAQHPAWDEVPRILARIKAPVFPQRDFDVSVPVER